MDMRLAKTTVLAVLLSIVALLVACGAEEQEEMKERETERVTGLDEADERFIKTGSVRFTIGEDSTTGCKYIVNDDYRAGGITPLLKSDGTPDCGGN